MREMPKPSTRTTIQLERMDEPREVLVREVNVSDETMVVVYEGTSPGSMFGDVQETVNWDDRVEEGG